MEKRIIIYAKDICLITGKSKGAAYRLIQKIKNEKGKERHHMITVKEFAAYMRIEESEVYKHIR